MHAALLLIALVSADAIAEPLTVQADARAVFEAPATSSVKAVVDGPTTVQVGDLIILDSSKSTCEDRLWILVYPNKQFYQPPGGLQAVASAGLAPGPWTWILVVWGKNGDKPASDKQLFTVTVAGPGPTPPGPTPPGPTPPVPPPVTSPLSDKVHAWAMAVALAPADRQRSALKLADAFDSIRAGILDGSITAPEQEIVMIAQAINSLDFPSRLPWKPWLLSLVAEIKSLDAAGKLPNMQAHAAVCADIAAGLRRVPAQGGR